MTFREYTPRELADALDVTGAGLDTVSFELLDSDGTVLASNVMLLRVSVDGDFDRTGGYSWVKVTARME